MLSFFNSPKALWRRLRSTNAIELGSYTSLIPEFNMQVVAKPKSRARVSLAVLCVGVALGLGVGKGQQRSSATPALRPALSARETVEVCYTNHAWAVPLFVAAECGRFSHQGLAVKLRHIPSPVHVRLGGKPAPGEDWPQIAWDGRLPAIVNFEDVEVLVGYGFDLAERARAASKLVLVHPVAITPTGDMITALLVRNGAGIKAWTDFKGKKLGVYEPRHVGDLQRVFRAHGLSALTGKKTDDIPSASLWRSSSHFDSGQLDALYTWGSIARKLLAERPRAYRVFAKNLECEPGGQPWYEACTYVNLEKLANRPGVIGRYVAAIDAAIDLIRAFPELARAIVPKYHDLDPASARRMELYHFLKSTETPDPKTLKRAIPPEVFYPVWAERIKAAVNR